jgi:hypothetical protein
MVWFIFFDIADAVLAFIASVCGALLGLFMFR